ncbi:MAG TPA: PKD domain-containing protein, partial [Cytophagaceae bacterium]
MIASRSWDLGDNVLSNLANPSHLYATPERFTVKLLAKSDSGCSAVAVDTVVLKPIPVAYFTIAGACSGKTIAFTDSSYYKDGPITSWKWDFGDGSISSDKNPSHTFVDGGPYKVLLTVTAFDNTKDNTSLLVYPGAVLTAGYSYLADCSKNNISFKDTSLSSSGAIVSWKWKFGDGKFASSKEPVHVYEKGGYYTVALLVSTSQGCVDSLSTNVYAGRYPDAKFTYKIASSKDTASFIGASAGKISSWSWTFGDTSTSSIQSPTHVYRSHGQYLVTMKVMSDSGCAGVFIDTIRLAPFLKPNISAKGGCTNNTISFSDSTMSNIKISSWKWDLGDGTTSALQSPIHTYRSAGTYSVKLTVSSEDGTSDSAIWEIKVNTNDFPVVHFGYNKICLNNTIAFKDSSDGNVLLIQRWLWAFGDDSVSTLKDPFHSYLSGGEYLVKLTVSNSQGCSSSKDSLITTATMPTAMIDTLSSFISPGKAIDFVNKSQKSQNYYWDFGDKKGISTEKDPIYSYSEPGEYMVTLVASSKDGCKDTSSYTL